MKHAVIISLVGVGVGFWTAYAATRYVSSSLNGVGPSDAFSDVAVALMVASAAALACVVSARRAARVDPLIALGEE